MKFEFDEKSIRIKMPDIDPGSSGKLEIDVKRDLYSAWKRWCLDGNLGKAPKAFQAHGGEILPNGERMESSFILLNNWRVLLTSGSYSLKVKGNLQSKDGKSPFIIPEGSRIEILPDNPSKEILGLKPALFGISIDLKALWSKVRGR